MICAVLAWLSALMAWLIVEDRLAVDEVATAPA